MSASGVRAGKVFVEIGADPKAFFAALNRVNKSIGNIGRAMAGAGSRLMAGGVGMAAPIAAAVSQGAKFESTLLNIRASTGATAGEIDRIKSASMAMSAALGVGPTEAAQGMLELLKAGMSLESVLGGAGQSALEFAKVGEMDVAQAAVVMSDAMNVFGVSGGKAANTLSAAADASSTSIAQMAEAFSMSSAVAGLANQSIDDLSATLAILANAGVKGSDAGTSVKTMLMRLMAPADDAAAAMAQVGLSVQSFRGADGKMRPMVEILGTLNAAMGNLDQAAKDDIFRRIFGADAIRAASILSSAGVDGFNAMLGSMAQALPVGEKFKTMMSGLAGAGLRLLAGLERVAISISDAVGPALQAIVPFIEGALSGFAKFASENKAAVAMFAQVAVAMVGVGSALVGLGISLQVASFGMGGVIKAAMLAASPLYTMAAAASFAGKSFALAMPETIKLANAVGAAMLSASRLAITYGSSLATMAAATASRLGVVSATWVATGIAASAGFLAHIKAMVTYYTGALAGVQAITISRAGATAAAWITSSVGVDTFANAMKASMATAGASAKLAASTIGPAVALIAQGTSAAATAVAGLVAPFAAPFVAAGRAVTSFASDIYGGLAFTMKSFAWWASGVSARMAQYVANLTGTVGATIASTASMAAAWVGSAARGVAMFVGGAVAGMATYLGSLAMAVAGSVSSAAAVAAAWLAPLAPLLLLSAAALGVGAAIKQFGGQIGSAFSSVGQLVSQAAGSIGSGFATAIADAVTVFGDLFATAKTTFNGIYEAITAGDLSGAMDILWAGLVAGWLRGTEAIMSYVDPWLAWFQDAFTVVGAEIYKTWDGLWVSVGNAINTAGAYMMGAFDNIINPILASWDVLEAGIRKAWIRISGIFKDGEAKKAELAKVDAEMKDRADKRAKERPGIEGRTAQAAEKNAKANKELEDRKKAVDADTQATMEERQAANRKRADERRSATQSAEENVGSTTRRRGAKRVMDDQYSELLKEVENASSLDQLHDLYGQFEALNNNGRLNSGQADILETAITDAQERLSKAGSSMASSPAEKAATAGAEAAGAQSQTSMASVAGTFSSLNLGQAFGGTSAAERTAKATEEIARNTRDMKADKVAA